MDSVMKGNAPTPRIFGLEPPLSFSCLAPACHAADDMKLSG